MAFTRSLAAAAAAGGLSIPARSCASTLASMVGLSIPLLAFAGTVHAQENIASGGEIDPVACLASAAAKRAGENNAVAMLTDKEACAKLVDAVERETVDAIRRTALDRLQAA